MFRAKLAIVVVGLLVGVQSSAFDIFGDVLPWPWGSECPFPWSKIDGDWSTRGTIHEQFSFVYKGETKNGSRILDVSRFDEDGRLIGEGEGVSPKGERIVRAAMVGVGPSKGKSYWALVRTYRENQAGSKSCTKNKLVTVITLRPVGSTQTEDVHIIIDKEETVRKKH